MLFKSLDGILSLINFDSFHFSRASTLGKYLKRRRLVTIKGPGDSLAKSLMPLCEYKGNLEMSPDIGSRSDMT